MKTNFRVLLELLHDRYEDQMNMSDLSIPDFMFAAARIIPFLKYHNWTLEEFVEEYIND